MRTLDQTLRETGRPRHEIETATFGVSHAEVGAYLLGVWGLPFSIIEATACCYNPGIVTAGGRELLAALHVADALVTRASTVGSGRLESDGIDLEFLANAGFADRLPQWRAIAADQLLVVAKVA
jgi:HD-like signal output (HDOD) protein